MDVYNLSALVLGVYSCEERCEFCVAQVDAFVVGHQAKTNSAEVVKGMICFDYPDSVVSSIFQHRKGTGFEMYTLQQYMEVA